MTRLVLVRHGETEWHGENRYAGSSDVALTARGLRQADQLARWSATAELVGIWSSDLARARLTAAVNARSSGVAVQVDRRLRELHFGRGEGRTAAEMDAEFPTELRAFRADPVLDHLPDGEDPEAAVDRFLDCLRDIETRHPDGRVLVVAHTTVIRLALCHLIGIPLSNYRRVFPFVRNCSITELIVNGPTASLLEFNSALSQNADGDVVAGSSAVDQHAAGGTA